VPVSDPSWRARVTEALRVHGAARLTAAPEERSALRSALLTLAAEPLEIDFLHVFPRVHGIARGPDGFSVALTLSEAVQ
jgi:hypothetical protein